jgi:hypothetical protein
MERVTNRTYALAIVTLHNNIEDAELGLYILKHPMNIYFTHMNNINEQMTEF